LRIGLCPGLRQINSHAFGQFGYAMSQKCCFLLLAGALVAAPVFARNHADLVVGYNPGTGAGSLTNAAAVLGAPSRETTDPHWGAFPVDPFGPPYLSSQVVALGSGGSLTVRLERTVENDPENPFGLDFIVFGNAFFQLNEDWTTTTGALGGTNSGITTVSVSLDGTHFFAVDPALAPPPDHLFPTDGAGDPSVPVNPSLTGADFIGKDLDGIRALYAGSAGGAAYDIGWARDDEGQPVVLPAIRYVRFEQANGEMQIDAISGIAKVPALDEDFGTDPIARGWLLHGTESLFVWNYQEGELEVTWDSAQPNSYFYRPLGTVLGMEDDFALGFSLELDALTVGPNPAKPYTFQLAVALMQWRDMIDPDFQRGTGVSAAHGPRNLMEFAYFADSGFGATIAPALISGENQFATTFNYPLELTLGDRFDVTLRYRAGDQTLRTEMNRNHGIFATIQDVVLPQGFSGFRFDTIAICSYSDEGQDPAFGGSILARGRIDALRVFLPDPPIHQLELNRSGTDWEARLVAQPGWSYDLERTVDFLTWDRVATHSSDIQGSIRLVDSTAPRGRAFYRVRAEKP
jgi:hypothetical protein